MPSPHIVSFQQAAAKILTHLKGEFAKLQTGRASAALVDHITVEAYGEIQPLRSLASIAVPDARCITVQPWDPSILGSLEKALQKANLGCNPVNEGRLLRLVLPSMTEDRRRQLVKVVSTLAEEARVSVRKCRQDAHTAIKAEPDEDVRRTADADLQKEVDRVNAEIGSLAKRKEEELMKV